METRVAGPVLPESRGRVSAAVVEFLRGKGAPPDSREIAGADPFGDDLQLALYLCYELHYRGFADVDADLEWDPELLRCRAALEWPFLESLRDRATRHVSAKEALDDLLVEPAAGDGGVGVGVGDFLQDEGELWQVREYAAQRSLYHLKEADPHAWVLPRLWGRAKAGMAAVEFDEFGGGRAERVHARLFADLMTDLGLDPAYGRYVDAAGAEALALVNLMSLFGLHRALRGALVGHFATVEITSSPVPGGSPTPCGGPGPAPPPSTSTTSTWRPTPYTSRSSGGRSSPGCWRRNRSWTPTWRSASTPPTIWRMPSPTASSERGGRAGRPFARRSDESDESDEPDGRV